MELNLIIMKSLEINPYRVFLVATNQQIALGVAQADGATHQP